MHTTVLQYYNYFILYFITCIGSFLFIYIISSNNYYYINSYLLYLKNVFIEYLEFNDLKIVVSFMIIVFFSLILNTYLFDINYYFYLKENIVHSENLFLFSTYNDILYCLINIMLLLICAIRYIEFANYL